MSVKELVYTHCQGNLEPELSKCSETSPKNHSGMTREN